MTLHHTPPTARLYARVDEVDVFAASVEAATLVIPNPVSLEVGTRARLLALLTTMGATLVMDVEVVAQRNDGVEVRFVGSEAQQDRLRAFSVASAAKQPAHANRPHETADLLRTKLPRAKSDSALS